MNTNLLNIVKRITADYGEAVLADPKRLKAFFGDLAKDEPKPLRTAFVCCVEAGALNALKAARNAGERAEHKEMLAQRVRDEQGLDRALCAESLDILEAALFAVTPEKPVCAKEVVNLQAGAYIILRSHFSSVKGAEDECYTTAQTATEDYGYTQAARFDIDADVASWLIKSVPASAKEGYGIFLVENTKDHYMAFIEHRTNWKYGLGYVEYIPGHFFRGMSYGKTVR
jgi:hypothetical protein